MYTSGTFVCGLDSNPFILFLLQGDITIPKAEKISISGF